MTTGLPYLAAGPLAAIFVGMLLVPLRDFTSASNLTFVFMVLTIAVAAGGADPRPWPPPSARRSAWTSC